jgi:hypothetical protein
VRESVKKRKIKSELKLFFRGRTNESQTLVFDDAASVERVQFDLDSDSNREEVYGGRAKR